MPCAKCKLQGSTQAAHLEKGGWGLKGDDSSCFPLCTVQYRAGGYISLGCHEKLDQHKEIPYWMANLERAQDTAKQTYELWKQGKLNEAEELINDY